MSYNDFSLPQNWETLAKAYASNLEDKGFVFIRLNENQKKKNILATACYYNLKTLEQAYQIAQKRNLKNQNFAFEKLLLLSSELSKHLQNFYSLEKNQNTATQTNFNFPSTIFKSEIQVIKNLVLLLDEEDNPQIRQFLKTSLQSKIEALLQTFE